MTARWVRATAALAAVAAVSLAPVRPADGAAGGTVYLRTVPALAGVTFQVGSGTVTTGFDGTAALQVADLNGVAATVQLTSPDRDANTRLTIDRVVPAPHIPHESHLTVGLDVTSLCRIAVTGGVAGVAPASVQSVRLHSVTGQIRTVQPGTGRPVTLLARRVQFEHGTLVAQTVTWSVEQVRAAPGIALTTSQPRFDPLDHPRWQLHVQPVAGTVVIDTVPATPSVTFLLEGATVTTGADGRARVPVSDLNDVDRKLVLQTGVAGPLSVSGLRVAKAPPPGIGQRRLIAALVVRREITLHFTDLAGRPISPRGIGEILLRGAGSVVSVSGQDVDAPVSLVAQTATQVAGRWEEHPVTYTLTSVRLGGGQAVFAGTQHFTPLSAADWTVALSVFTLHVTVHDALFGSQVSGRAVLTRPNGADFPIRLSDARPTDLTSLVRGLYGLNVDAAVIGGHTELLVSRDDHVDLRVVTLLDAFLIAVGSVVLLVVIILGGRMVARREAARRLP